MSLKVFAYINEIDTIYSISLNTKRLFFISFTFTFTPFSPFISPFRIPLFYKEILKDVKKINLKKGNLNEIPIGEREKKNSRNVMISTIKNREFQRVYSEKLKMRPAKFRLLTEKINHFLILAG